MSTGLANPAEMIAQGAPHIIHNDAELEAYTNALFQLTALESPSSSEVEAIELLTVSHSYGRIGPDLFRSLTPCAGPTICTIRDDKALL